MSAAAASTNPTSRMRGCGKRNRGIVKWTDRTWPPGTTFPQAIDSFMPLMIGPQAVVWACCSASDSLAPEAVAELLRPLYSTVTAHSTFWLVSVE